MFLGVGCRFKCKRTSLQIERSKNKVIKKYYFFYYLMIQIKGILNCITVIITYTFSWEKLPFWLWKQENLP